MINLVFIFIITCIIAMIWKLRQQSELATLLITKHCFQLDLQLLSVARGAFNFKPSQHFLEACFVFEFSSDNENNYQGKLYLLGLQRARFALPPYRCFD